MAPSAPVRHDLLSWRIHNTFIETIDSNHGRLAMPRSHSLSSLEKLRAETPESTSDFDSSPRAGKALQDLSPRSSTSTSILSTAASLSPSQSDSEAPDFELPKTKLRSSSAPFVPSSIPKQAIPCEKTEMMLTTFDQPVNSAARGHNKRHQNHKGQRATGKSGEAVKRKSKDPNLRPLLKRAEVQAKALTTFLVRNVVCRYSEQDIMDILDKTDLAHKYDYVYVPKGCDRLTNMGYFFLNLKAPEYADLCMAALSGKVFGDRPTTKICQVSNAQFQGEELIAHLSRKDKRALANLRWCEGCGPEVENKSCSNSFPLGITHATHGP